MEFGVKSSEIINPDDYQLIDGTGPDLFEWPSVVNDHNIRGPLSVAVPGMVAGLECALSSFGSMDWADVLAPAVRLAEQGIEVDWYGTLKIASESKHLARFDHSREIFLPGGHVPVGEWAGPLPTIRLGELAHTLRRLASARVERLEHGRVVAKGQHGVGRAGVGDQGAARANA